MRCKNCNLELHAAHIGGWCLDCIGKLVARESAARAGWQLAFAAWGMYTDGKVGLGHSVPIVEALENAFKAGWAARGLPDPSRHGMSIEEIAAEYKNYNWPRTRMAASALIRRYEDCALQIWKLFSSDPLPDDDPAHFWIERLESILKRDLLVPVDVARAMRQNLHP